MSVNAASIGNLGRYIPVLLWLHRNSTIVPALIEDVRVIREATTNVERANALCHAIQLVAPVLDDFPTLLGAADEGAEYAHLDADIAAAHATFAAQGLDWSKLLTLLPELFPLILQIITLLKG